MLLAAAWAPQIARFPPLWQYLQSILAYVTPPVVAVFLLGLFWRRGNSSGAVVTLAAGIPHGVLGWAGNELLGWFDLQFLYASGLILVASLSLFVIASMLSPRPEPQRLHCCTTRLWSSGGGGGENARAQSERWRPLRPCRCHGAASGDD